MIEFDHEFASTVDYANLYRILGLQAVPALYPKSGESWKRPAIDWKQHTKELTSEKDFVSWYGSAGSFKTNKNIGIITGVNSPNGQKLFVIDIDTYKGSEGQDWLRGLLAVHNNDMEIETVTVVTGGGGAQLYLWAPPTWTPPTIKLPHLHLDIRGAGGFVVAPPSLHESGRSYLFKAGCEPWEIEIAEAPPWLCEAIDKAAGTAPGGHVVREQTPTPARVTDGLGLIADGREDYATRLVWGRVLDLYRDCPIPPTAEDQQEALRAAWNLYESRVRSRLPPTTGSTTATLLEREGRGITMFREKWQAAIAQWDTKVRDEALKEKPHNYEETIQSIHDQIINDGFGPKEKPKIRLSFSEIFSMPDPKWIIKGVIPEGSFGVFFGTPGCGKSFIAIDIALSLATGKTSWANKQIEKSGPVILVTSEGVSSLKHRLKAWTNNKGAMPDNDGFSLIHHPLNFMNAQDVSLLVEQVEEVAAASSAPVLIVVDTLSRVIPGADENKQDAMSLLVAACNAVQARTNAALLCVHHTSKAGSLRGSTVLEGAADYIMEVEREKGQPLGRIEAKKIKDAADGWGLDFALQQVVVGLDGATSLVASVGINPQDYEEDKHETDNRWPDKRTLACILRDINDAKYKKKPWTTNTQGKRTGIHAASNISAFYKIKFDIANNIIETWMMNDILREYFDGHEKRKGIEVYEWPQWARQALYGDDDFHGNRND